MNLDNLKNFAELESSAEKAGGDIFSALGIDLPTLLFQIIAFLILVFLLGKFVYPVLLKTIDKRQADIDKAAKAAEESMKKSEEAEQKIATLLSEAQKQAGEIVDTAKQESQAMLTSAEEKAKARSEAIVASAKDEISKEVESAKKSIKSEAVELVASATEMILKKKIDKKYDQDLIAKSLKEAEK